MQHTPLGQHPSDVPHEHLRLKRILEQYMIREGIDVDELKLRLKHVIGKENTVTLFGKMPRSIKKPQS